MKYMVQVTLICAFGKAAGTRFTPEIVGKHKYFWVAKLRRWLCEIIDNRHPREYAIVKTED